MRLRGEGDEREGKEGASPEEGSLNVCVQPSAGEKAAVVERFEAGATVTREGAEVVVRHTIVPPRTNGLCVAAMVLGVVAMVLAFVPFFDLGGFVMAVLAIIFGVLGMSAAPRRGQAGRGMGIAGLVLGIISGTFTLVILFVFFWGIFGF